MFNKSATCRVVVARPSGLHARPSLAVAQTVQRFRSRVQVRSGKDEADAASVLQLLSLGAGQGRELTLTAKGPDADQVLAALRYLFEHNFGMDDE